MNESGSSERSSMGTLDVYPMDPCRFQHPHGQLQELTYPTSLYGTEEDLRIREFIQFVESDYNERLQQSQQNVQSLTLQNQHLVSQLNRIKKEFQVEKERRIREENERKAAQMQLENRVSWEQNAVEEAEEKAAVLLNLQKADESTRSDLEGEIQDLKAEVVRLQVRLEEVEKSRQVALMQLESASHLKGVAESQIEVLERRLAEVNFAYDSNNQHLQLQYLQLQEEHRELFERCEAMQNHRHKTANEHYEQIQALQQILRERESQEEDMREKLVECQSKIDSLKACEGAVKSYEIELNHEREAVLSIRRLHSEESEANKTRLEMLNSKIEELESENKELVELLKALKSEQIRIKEELTQLHVSSEGSNQSLMSANQELSNENNLVREQCVQLQMACQAEVSSLQQQLQLERNSFTWRIHQLELTRSELAQQLQAFHDEEKSFYQNYTQDFQSQLKEKESIIERISIEVSNSREVAEECSTHVQRVEQKQEAFSQYVKCVQEQLLEDMDSLHAEVGSLQKVNVQLQRQAVALQEQNKKAAASVQKYSSEMKTMKQAKDNLEMQLMEFRVQREAMQEKIKTVQQQCEEEKRIQLQTQSTQIASLQKEVDSLRQLQKDLRSQSDQLKKTRNSLQEENNNLNETICSLRKDMQFKDSAATSTKIRTQA